jgi:hypothetical protein
MPDLIIRLKKNRDGSAALSCTRADGSTTWHRQLGQQGAFFPLHDLTHYALESVFGFREAFYGLLADGWNVTDFGKPWRRGPLPPEAVHAEVLVGLLDTERATGNLLTAAEFNQHAGAYAAQHGRELPPIMTDERLIRIRALRSDLFRRWLDLAPGATLELEFRRAGAPGTPPAVPATALRSS